MQDFSNHDSLHASFLNVNQRIDHFTQQVDILQQSFADLGNRLAQEFRLLERNVITEVQGIKMGSALSRSPRECTLASWLPNAEQNLTDGTTREQEVAAIIEIRDRELAQLKEQTETTRIERDHACHERNRESRRFEFEYKKMARKFDDAEQRVAPLTAKNNMLNSSCDELARQKDILHSKIEGLESEKRAVLMKLTSAEDDKQRLQGQAVVLRGMITKNRGLNGTQVDDNTIAASFIKLRDQIQGIAIKLCSWKSDRVVLQGGLDQQQRRYFAYWQGSSSLSQLQHRTRAVVFEMMYDMILQHKWFGLENLGENSEVERGLVEIESAMDKMSQGHEDDVAEWRTQTMRCASFLQLENTIPGQIVKSFQCFFAPLWPQPPAEDKLHALFTQLCKDAFTLGMLLRCCKDKYRCEFPPDRSRLTGDTEPQEREPRHEDMSDGLTDQDIAYTVSGMLVKYPEQDSEKRLVLVTAHDKLMSVSMRSV
ncbi:hypothetical protein IFR05_010466 [Cadophora sp. M221]|nr:hypothetical protein IFR05_010466 [Cadophora sp. M221]